jgi:flagellar protein FlaG
MDIQLGTTSLPALESTVARAVPAPGTDITGQSLSAAPQPIAPAQQPLGSEGLQQVVRQINDFLKSSASNVQFTVDSQSDKVVVRIVDSQTNQLIRQFPSEEMLAISQSIDQMTGLLLQLKA